VLSLSRFRKVSRFVPVNRDTPQESQECQIYIYNRDLTPLRGAQKVLTGTTGTTHTASGALVMRQLAFAPPVVALVSMRISPFLLIRKRVFLSRS
jgi:hypothetical protein